MPFKKPWSPTKWKSRASSFQVSISADNISYSGPDCSCDMVVKPIENLSGHSINPYQIHGGKSILLVKNDDRTKMEEGEYFAIETFGSTGTGRVIEEGECSHYARVFDPPNIPLRYDLQ